MKACVNCKHYADWGMRWSPPTCVSPLASIPDPVYGKVYRSAQSQREIDGVCGPDGKLYEPTLWQRICALLSGAIAA